MKTLAQMGQAERLAKLFIVVLLSLAGIATAIYQGGSPDLQPIAQLLTELVTAGSAGIVVRYLVDKLKARFPGISPLSRYWVAMALSASISPAAYLGLVALRLTELTEKGAIMAVTAAFVTATTIHKELE